MACKALTIGELHHFFVLLVFHPFTDCGSKRRETTKQGQAKIARRQTETTYLKEVLEWLTQYWTDEASTSEVRLGRGRGDRGPGAHLLCTRRQRRHQQLL
jgi:hypothetical protein